MFYRLLQLLFKSGLILILKTVNAPSYIWLFYTMCHGICDVLITQFFCIHGKNCSFIKHELIRLELEIEKNNQFLPVKQWSWNTIYSTTPHLLKNFWRLFAKLKFTIPSPEKRSDQRLHSHIPFFITKLTPL